MTNSTPPRWDLSNVYPGLETPELTAAFEQHKSQITELETFAKDSLSSTSAETPVEELGRLIGEAVDRFNAAYELGGTIRAYIYSFVSTDSHNQVARRLQSEFEQTEVRMQMLDTQFTSWIGRIAPVLDAAIQCDERAKAHTFILKETADQSKYLMSDSEESLAAELSLSGASAWNKLQGTITSQLSVDFELDGEVKSLSMPALINLHSHPDEDVRRRAYEAEIKAWDNIREPLASSLNGVKGTSLTLQKRRGREDFLHAPLDQARIDRPTLDAMLDAMRDSFTAFRRYFHAKAKRIGKEKLAWWDVFAPVGASTREYSYDEARELILENFERFSPVLSSFAQRAFDNNWIDAEQRVGKRGGAFCMGVPGVKESRVLANFDGSLDQVSTIAHELGHAFHNECAYRANKTILQKQTPMTMAETASIMCETVVSQAILKSASDPQERLAILETSLIGDAQVVVDIYSRFLFESEVFERRAKAELSADDFCDIMERAQKATYGDGLDERYLHKYMWTWKPHYYFPGLDFYNFPYTFGLLFGTGLYAIYQKRGEAFINDYMDLLASTGEGTAAELAGRFGIDIRQKEFWAGSLKVIEDKIDQYTRI
ncbi:MAG: M3 family oligoendopeptidase [Chloroflexi bacterium]|nr:MAG: M3 family oligoendopeptidase [Chloroflexota bacterium]